MVRKNLGPQSGYSSRLLHPPDIRAAQAMFERAADYFELATGAPPAQDEATRAFVAGPPSKSVDDKRIIGVFDKQDALVGVLDALVDFPDRGDWTMGMLLLDPAHRGAGLGGAVLEEYETWAVEQSARQFHTAVGSHHQRALRFLRSRGYEPQRELPNYNAGAKSTTVVFLLKRPMPEKP